MNAAYSGYAMPVYYNFDASGSAQPTQTANAYYQQPFNNNFYNQKYPLAAQMVAPIVVADSNAAPSKSNNQH